MQRIGPCPGGGAGCLLPAARGAAAAPGRNVPQSQRLWPLVRFCAALVLGVAAEPVNAAVPTDEWRFLQTLTVPQAGLVKLSLPPETLGAARAGLEDLRVLDGDENELPYAIERVVPARPGAGPARSFQPTLADGETVLLLETSDDHAAEGVTLETVAVDFVKAASVDGSNDRESWTPLLTSLPVFRQAGASQLHLPFPAGAWRWLRLRMDDRRSAPVAFTGASIHRPVAVTPAEVCPVDLLGVQTAAGVSRLRLRLPARHLQLASIELDTLDPLFTREARVLAIVATETSDREDQVAQGTIYRLTGGGQPASSNLTVHVEAFVASSELVVEIRNEDNPPLAIQTVRAWRRPVHLVFRAPAPGDYRLLTGHRDCPAPRYDLASLGTGFASLPVSKLQPGTLTPNSEHLPPPLLRGVEPFGAPLDVSAWRFRKPVRVAQPGVQSLELDFEVLSRAESDYADLRLMRGGVQVPFLREDRFVTRSATPGVTLENDPKRPRTSRWQLQLPHAGLPLTRLRCVSPMALFERRVELFEEPTDERGMTYRRPLGATTWLRRPAQGDSVLTLELTGTTLTDTFILETDNGDNPPLALDQFELNCPVPRLLFKLADVPADLFLHYGNQESPPPSYDLGLVAAELRAAEKVACALGSVEELRGATWRERGGHAGSGSPVFWLVLAGVGVGLLVIVVRLLPRPPGAS